MALNDSVMAEELFCRRMSYTCLALAMWLVNYKVARSPE